MGHVSRGRGQSAARVARVWAHGLGLCLAGCAELLGIPDDPVLVPADPSLLDPADADSSGVVREPTLSPSPGDLADAGAGSGGLGTEGALPPGSVTGIDGSFAADAAVSDAAADPPPASEAGLDGGVSDAALGPDAGECSGLLGRVPIDVVFVFDNSGSMAAEAAAFERALPAFAERLDREAVDYRIILLSRHRVADRESSEEASTSVCIGAPLGGVACPSRSPLLTPRFFQYSIKIDARDSFERILESFAEPDPFELTREGWSEWLRADAHPVFIEISDSDSDVPVADFLAALAARDTRGQLFAEGAPRFVFHSLVGLAPKQVELAVYAANEPIETETCSGDGGQPDNAGETYQALSRRTGGSRAPVCPPALLDERLQGLATDVVLRSVRLCLPAD